MASLFNDNTLKNSFKFFSGICFENRLVLVKKHLSYIIKV